MGLYWRYKQSHGKSNSFLELICLKVSSDKKLDTTNPNNVRLIAAKLLSQYKSPK
jgi:hypothetical protein